MYLPFGGTRWESGATPTDFQFTGQRKEAGIGLYDYNARYYDPLNGGTKERYPHFRMHWSKSPMWLAACQYSTTYGIKLSS
jgi:hypothetical protein